MSHARRLMLLVLAVIVAVALLAGVGVAVLSGDGTGPRQGRSTVAQDLPGTVVLVPGYGGSTSALEVLAARLQQDGRSTLVLQLPGEGTGDLVGYADLLDSAVQQALAAGAPSVDLVGYSAGGIVVRQWLSENGPGPVRRVVTLGSPHHGTDVAATGNALAPGQCPEACRQLVPGSGLLDDLNEGDETPYDLPWVSLWTAVDETVTPPDSARLDGATNIVLQDVCPGATTSHSDLPRDPQVQGLVRAALGAGPVTVPAGCPQA